MVHVAVTTTLPMLDCLWLEKVKHTAEEDGKPLLPAWQLSHREAVEPPFTFKLFTHNCGRNYEGRALISDSHNVHCNKLEKLKQTGSAHRGSSLNRQARSETKPTPILQEEGDFAAGPMQPDDMQRIITHSVVTRVT